MVSSEEIIERSMYMNLLAVALKAGVTIDPDDYLNSSGLPTKETEARYLADKAKIKKFVYIFGIGRILFNTISLILVLTSHSTQGQQKTSKDTLKDNSSFFP